MLNSVPMSDEQKVIEFIPRAEWEKTHIATLSNESPDYTKVLPKELTRKRIAQNFVDAFELLGGTQKLVEWASIGNENYGTFLKLYARLMPSPHEDHLEENLTKIIKHILPRTSLDQ